MLLLSLLLLSPAALSDDGALSRRDAKSAYADVNEALYHLPTEGTLRWTVRTTLGGPDSPAGTGRMGVELDLSSRALSFDIEAGDPEAAQLMEARDQVLVDSVIGVLLAWHDEPLKMDRGDYAWTREGEVVFALLGDASGEFLHTDAFTGLPLYAKDSTGLTVNFEFQDTPQGALLRYAENRRPDGSAEIGMEMDHRQVAPGVWMVEHAVITSDGLFVGEFWFEGLTYTP